MRQIERTTNENGRAYAIRAIRENIISLDLAPGMHVSANDLTAELGLSRGPIREALNELSKTGIVEVYPQSGCRISLIDEEVINEARFFRRSLECAIAGEAAQKASEEDIRALEENMVLQNFYLENHLGEKLLEADDGFHKKLFEIVGMQNVYDLMKNFCIHLDRLRRLSIRTIKDIRIVEDHQKILQAIREGRAEDAGRQMKEHLNRDTTDILTIRKQNPDYFS